MKKFVCLVFAAAVLLTVSGCSGGQDSSIYLRVHIRANSNSAGDQDVKYAVKAAIVNELTPVLSECGDKEQAVKAVNARLQNLRQIADSVLQEKGFNYRSNVRLDSEKFPLRSYGEFTFEEGVYDALIVELGSGEGDNWWCMVYPPICFVGGTDNGSGKIEYKSKLLEIVQQFKEKYFS